MSAFGEYAAWYDAFNEGKEYGAEARYVLERVKTWHPFPTRWLDVGCGTGNHLACLQSMGIDVEGVDASPAMIAQARAGHPGIPFHLADARGYRLERAFDVISMLFHVMSYQQADRAVAGTLENAAAHLAPGGVVVFDFWHTDGVSRDPPGVRMRKARIGSRHLFRIARPTEDRARSAIDIRYEFRWDSPEGPVAHREEHALRHFTVAELESFLDRAGFDLLASEAWMQAGRSLQPEDWYGLIGARKRIGT